MHPFQAAIEARDVDAAAALLAPDVTFRSPVVFKPYARREDVRLLLHALAKILEDFRYTRVIGHAQDHALMFEARIGERIIEGCDFLHTGHDGSVDELTVMVRPLSGAYALAAAMAAEMDSTNGGRDE